MCTIELCSSFGRTCINANIEYVPEGCMCDSMSRANDFITGEIEDLFAAVRDWCFS